MRVAGIVLIIVGVLMLVFNGINYTQKKEVADLGPIEINKTENKRVGWPMYAGGIVAALGVVLVVAAKKK
jgi:drug/metabolite transporter (DMT)-like permease